MPRNRNKTLCQVPGCHNWAMRAHTHCRSHLDRELGARGGGAPQGNLNALKTAGHARPLTTGSIQDLAEQLARQPHLLPELLDPVLRDLHARTGDPYKTLVALRPVLSDLSYRVAVGQFKAETETLLRSLPALERNRVLRSLQEQFASTKGETALASLRSLTIELRKRGKTSTGT